MEEVYLSIINFIRASVESQRGGGGVFYDRFDDEYGKLPAAALAERESQRQSIQRLDNLALGRVRKIFTNGRETSRRR